MKTLIAVILFFSSYIVRSVRWLALAQQKEYRFDRLKLFLKSKEGVNEFFRIFPHKTDFSRTGLKRPKITFRTSLVLILYLLLSFSFLFWGFQEVHSLSGTNNINIFIELILLLIFILLYLFLIPIFIFISIIPTTVLVSVQTYFTLYKARKLLSKHNPKIIGITGSYGKTSTKLLLSHVLQTQHSVFLTPKSYNTKYSIASSILKNYSSEEVAVIEYGAYKIGEIAAITKWIRPSLAIVTGLTEQHLGLFGSIENIITAKSELVASLHKEEVVICNAYDERTLEICKTGAQKNGAQIISIRENSGPAQLQKVGVNDRGKLFFTWKGTHIQTQLYGVQYQELIRTVITASHHFGISDANIIKALQTFVPNEKFIFSYTLSLNDVLVIDDGDTSNPKGFSAIIHLAKNISAHKKILVTSGIVDLGSRSREIHLELARTALPVFDSVLYVGESGYEAFKIVMGEKVVKEKEVVISLLKQLSEKDLVIIEGRMPPWISSYLE